MNKHHYWHAPKVTGVPGPTSVVIRTDCGIKQTLPAWQVREWEATAPAMPPLNQTCPACLLAHIETLADTDLDAAQALASRALHPSTAAITPTDYMRLAGRLHRKQAAARRNG